MSDQASERSFKNAPSK